METNIEKMFEMFSRSTMKPRPYFKETPRASVTVPMGPEEFEILHVVAARLGASRANIAHQILKIALYEAARGCGFTFDENGHISEDQKKWDLAPRTTGFSFVGEDKEEK